MIPHGPHVRLSSDWRIRFTLSVLNNLDPMRKATAADARNCFRTKPGRRGVPAKPPSSNVSSSSTAGKFDRFGRKARWCNLCNCTSDSDSPLSSSKPDDKYFGCRPWNRLSARQIMDMEKGLVMIEDPEGYYCGLCPGLWRMIGDGEFHRK
jgi:hypothetical protein